MKQFVTLPAGMTEVETCIDRSRFIAAAKYTGSIEEAESFIEFRRKCFPDATHTCYAYLIGDKAKYFDDNEPQGTAGLPILNCLKNSGLDCVCAVVTRFYGGINLGANGLIRAYSGTVADVIRLSDRVNFIDCTEAEIITDYVYLSAIRRALQGQAKELSVDFVDKIKLVYRFPSELLNTISGIVCEKSFGKAEFKTINRLLTPFVQ